MGEVMDGKMEEELKEGRTTGQTELREMDEGEGVLMKLLIKARTDITLCFQFHSGFFICGHKEMFSNKEVFR